MSYPLDRDPDVITFEHHTRTTYVVDLSTDPPNVKAETGHGELREVEFWAEGELMMQDVAPFFLTGRHRELYHRAHQSYISALEAGCEAAEYEVERKAGLPEVE